MADEAAAGDFLRDLLRWSAALAGIARTGMGFTQSLYERERYEEVLHVAADIRAAAEDELMIRREDDHFVQEWLDSVGDGVAGYVTPKVAVGAVVGNDAGEILLVRRADSGVWLYPTGWADVGYSPAEVAMKEVKEETGIDCEVVRLIAVIDDCRALGGKLEGHPLETSDVGWFAEDAMPWPLAGADAWAPTAFAAIKGGPIEVMFDRPRMPVWRPHGEV